MALRNQGEWVDVPDPDLIATYEENAKYTIKRDKRINIRLTQKDFEGIQKRAIQEGIPYQHHDRRSHPQVFV